MAGTENSLISEADEGLGLCKSLLTACSVERVSAERIAPYTLPALLLKVRDICVTELQLPDLFEAAARATINDRCASAYLHDIRGSMQALYSALELLGRSARSGGDNLVKVERACDLAKRAIGNHEKSTLGVLELLASANPAATTFDMEQLAGEAVHFLRNEAATRSVKITLKPGSKPLISAERHKFQVLVVGLLTAAIDDASPGSELHVEVIRREDFAILSLGSAAGYDGSLAADELLHNPERRLQPRELTFLFARKFLGSHGGRLAMGATDRGTAVLQIWYPSIAVQA